MRLKLRRLEFNDEATIGELSIDDEFFCYTLEPTKLIIPTGSYQVIIDMSHRFNKLMPHICNVPSREGIRIHSGNTASDSEGCVLVGTDKIKNKVLNSRLAYSKLYEKLDEALKTDKVTITIVEEK